VVQDYKLIERIPTPGEHRAMFEAVGWQPYTEAETGQALANTLYGVIALKDGAIIGMGRVIGDGGKFFYVQDFAICPEYQGQGIGTAMMDRMMAYIQSAAPGDPFVGLFATEMAIPFYRKYGFEPRTEILSGMWTVVQNEG
jgi:ribosomal protein S18 acetylase RimI-like enzyme